MCKEKFDREQHDGNDYVSNLKKTSFFFLYNLHTYEMI